MSTTRDPDRLIHDFLLEGEDELFDQVYDTVRAEIEHKRQRVIIGPWRMPIMNRLMAVGLGIAAVVVIGLFLGYQLLAEPNNLGGPSEPTATPEPTATLQPSSGTLASGSFTAPLGEFGEAFDIEAVRTGDDVSGTMEISNPTGGEGAYSVDVQCAGTIDDVLMIGGEVTDSTYQEFIEDGAYVVIALARGTPVRMLWAVDVLVADEVRAPAESCSAYVESLLGDPEFLDGLDAHGRPIDGDLELGQ